MVSNEIVEHNSDFDEVTTQVQEKSRRETRESFYIREFQTEINGMNIKK